MWQRFTEEARRVVFFAQEEAGRLRENQVATEHLLLGLTREGDGAAAKTLASLNVSLQRIRTEVERVVTRGEGRLGQDMQLTARAKRVIDLAYEEARGLNNDYIGSEHLLLGMIREEEGLAGRILRNLEVEYAKARGTVILMQKAQISDATASTPADLKGKDLLKIADLNRDQLTALFDMTTRLKTKVISTADQRKILEGKTLAMIFEKPSLRTRVSFETGVFQLGGQGIYLQPTDIQLGKRETIADAARNLERFVDIIMARVFEHRTVAELAEYASIPVINGLCDLEHPCQALADFQTILEHKGKFEGLKMAFLGDGNNVSQSLMLLAAKVGMNFTLGCPTGYDAVPEVVAQAKKDAGSTGATIETVYDPAEAAKDADIIVTDVWASMGMEDEVAERERAFSPFQVNAALMKHAKPDAIFMHCLPAHRGSEVTDEVIDSPQSVVFDEAENRLHAQKAVMVLLAS